MTNDKKNGFERLEGGEIVRVWNRHITAREKIKFKTNKQKE